MLFKLSFSNIRRSLRDYAIYFFTLIIGVSVFYVFNAVGTQAAMLEVSQSRNDVVPLLEAQLSGVSVFVAGVLGLLIVYASRFLMKRRNREFALYMTLGMSKGRISAILLVETFLIGIGSLAVGLLAGIGLSQLMSALVANLFEADMAAYRFTVSGGAILKTIVYFAMMYLVVMVCSSFVVTRLKLIDLLQAGKKSEQIKLKSPVLCVIVFLLAAGLLGFAYYQVGWNSGELTQSKMLLFIAMGTAGTFLVFWSVSGMLLRIAMSLKSAYYRGLNSFTFRQISSKVNTMVFSMTIICLMLFVTICTLNSAFSIRNSMNANLREYCTADYDLWLEKEESDGTVREDIETFYAEAGYDLAADFSEYVHFAEYEDPDFTFAAMLGEHVDEAKRMFPYVAFDAPETLIRVSDYNALCRLYGKDTVSLAEDEFLLLCNYKPSKTFRDAALTERMPVTVFGHTLYAKTGKCQDGHIDIAAQPLNDGVYIVPDSVIDERFAAGDHFIGNYAADTDEARLQAEEAQRARLSDLYAAWSEQNPESELHFLLQTRIELYESAIGLGAIATFLGLYIGLVFLIACGAILALKELSESVDSIGRYEILRRIGAEEGELSASLFMQTGIFFLLPLLLAVIHSVFGMKYATVILVAIGTENMWQSFAGTSALLLMVYGGYFLVTFVCSRGIIRNER